MFFIVTKKKKTLSIMSSYRVVMHRIDRLLYRLFRVIKTCEAIKKCNSETI